MNNNTTDPTSDCSPLLYIAPEDVQTAADSLSDFATSFRMGNVNYSGIESVLNNSSNSSVYSLPSIELDISDSRSEKVHTFDSAALLLIMFLLFLTVITIWVFKAKRIRVFHETGLSLIYGRSFTKGRTYIHLHAQLQ